MYLKSLVLKGFKSFADRSALTLEPGITAIVGPNGSGKSNISDAVLWVLGERNAKHLRGQAMEDVIFAGSSARRATGLAEVDLVLDNSDGTLPVDYDEVAITRRMYRSGESEYLINGTVARRMDVLDILHDSGLGTGTHSIISQGSLDSILQSKPEDRRALIEEAAGTLKHKQRKAKSERKLAQMDQHLARVRDVTAEVERQLKPLERKAKRARTYQGLSAELSELKLQLAVDDLRQLQEKHAAATAREEAVAAELEAKRAEISAAEAAAEALQEKIRQEGASAGELTRQHRQASGAVERIESAELVMRERKRAATSRAGELAVSLEANAVRTKTAQADLDAANAQLAGVQAERAQAEEKVSRLAADHADVTARRAETEKRATELGRASRDLEARINSARAKHAELKEALTNGLAHMKIIEGRTQELSLQFDRAKAEAEQAEAHASELDRELSSLDQAEKEIRTRVGEAMRAAEAARASRDEAIDVERACAASIDALREVERASAKAQGPALEWLTANAASFDAAIAPLAHEISAPEGQEALVEFLLGSDAAALLVADSSCAANVVSALTREGKSGEVTLVLRDDGNACAAPDATARPKGAPGRALISDLTFPESSARAVRALLGDVVVCECLEEALAAHEADALGLRFAVPDGCMVWPSGKVVAGQQVNDEGQGALVRARRIEELSRELHAAKEATQKAREAADAAESALRTAQGESLAKSQELAAAKGKADAARAAADAASRKLTSTRCELEDVERQRTEAEQTIAEARPNVEEYARLADELGCELEGVKESLAVALDAAAPLRDAAQQATDALAEARLAAATLVERETYTVRVRDARAGELAQLAAQARTQRVALRAKEVSASRIDPLLAIFEELAQSARRWTIDLEDKASQAEDSQSGLHAQANDARAKARAARDAYDAANERLSTARVDKGRLEVQVEAAVNEIVHGCRTPLETALALPALEDRHEVEDAAFKLRRRIANLGAINPDAADEYDALKVRYDYLASQLADLDGARKSLAKINRVIDARMKDDFVRTFDAVNANFQEIFATLFPGGSAHLSLVNPEDLENTGVEVSAQPRGKRIAKMTLMSGGEKSLTAIALLFAVYRIRTTPFYILDEVEAALDDTNLRRLIAFVESLRDTTQLIMITHQRRTMETADVLFGVSMQADGVTKVVSQKLDRALQYAE